MKSRKRKDISRDDEEQKREKGMMVKRSRRRRGAIFVPVDPIEDDPDMHLLGSLNVVESGNSSNELDDQDDKESTVQHLSRALQSHSFFLTVPLDVKAKLYTNFLRAAHKDKHYIFQRGDIASTFYVVRSGKIHLVGDDGNTERIVQQGQSLGELALISPSAQEFSAVCVGNVRLWQIDGGVFRFLMQTITKERCKMLTNIFKKWFAKEGRIVRPEAAVDSLIEAVISLHRIEKGEKVRLGRSPADIIDGGKGVLCILAEGQADVTNPSDDSPEKCTALKGVASFSCPAEGFMEATGRESALIAVIDASAIDHFFKTQGLGTP